MNHDPYKWGRPLDSTYGTYDHAIAQAREHKQQQQHLEFPTMHTQLPLTTGTSVVAIKYADGVMVAADHLGLYGLLLRFTDLDRIFRVGEAVVGVSGDVLDMQKVERLLDELEVNEGYDCPGNKLLAPHVHEYLLKVFYLRRSKMDPLWNAVVVGGFDELGKPFLGYVDLLGVTYQSPTMATGFGAHLAVPLLRLAIPNAGDEDTLSEADARETLLKCMRVLYYRDARAHDKYTLATFSKDGFKSEELTVENQQWGFAREIRGYGSTQI